MSTSDRIAVPRTHSSTSINPLSGFTRGIWWEIVTTRDIFSVVDDVARMHKPVLISKATT